MALCVNRLRLLKGKGKGKGKACSYPIWLATVYRRVMKVSLAVHIKYSIFNVHKSFDTIDLQVI